jgi:hypothetical protein
MSRRQSHPSSSTRETATAPSRSRSGHDQGYPAARFWMEPVDERFAKIGTYEVYQVKCNLVNGLPPRYRGERD